MIPLVASVPAHLMEIGTAVVPRCAFRKPSAGALVMTGGVVSRTMELLAAAEIAPAPFLN